MSIKKNSIEVLRHIHREIFNNFNPNDLEKLDIKIKKHMLQLPKEKRSVHEQNEEANLPLQEQCSIELQHVEFRKRF
jgi:hypothetical protein